MSRFLAAARARCGSNTAPRCYSLPPRRFATLLRPPPRQGEREEIPSSTAVRSRSGSDSPPGCHSRPSRRCATLHPTPLGCNGNCITSTVQTATVSLRRETLLHRQTERLQDCCKCRQKSVGIYVEVASNLAPRTPVSYLRLRILLTIGNRTYKSPPIPRTEGASFTITFLLWTHCTPIITLHFR